MNLDPRSLPEALQDDPPRPTPGHPQWALDERAQIERADRMRRLGRFTLGVAILAFILAAVALVRWGGWLA